MPRQRPIAEVVSAHTDSLMEMPGVVGTGIGLCEHEPCIQIFVVDSAAAEHEGLPDRLEGYPVDVRVTGGFRPRGS